MNVERRIRFCKYGIKPLVFEKDTLTGATNEQGCAKVQLLHTASLSRTAASVSCHGSVQKPPNRCGCFRSRGKAVVGGMRQRDTLCERCILGSIAVGHDLHVDARLIHGRQPGSKGLASKTKRRL